MFNEEINGDLQLFQQLCAGCYGRLFYTKQQKNDIPKTLSISRINHSRVMSISEWYHMASRFALHFWTFQRISIEWIDNKVNLPNSKVNPNFNWFSLVVFHFSVYILQISVHFDRPQILIYSSIQDRYVIAMFLLHQYFSLKSNMKRNQNFTSIYFNFFDMGTLKSVCSSWFAPISRDKYERTLLRVPIL